MYPADDDAEHYKVVEKDMTADVSFSPKDNSAGVDLLLKI